MVNHFVKDINILWQKSGEWNVCHNTLTLLHFVVFVRKFSDHNLHAGWVIIRTSPTILPVVASLYSCQSWLFHLHNDALQPHYRQTHRAAFHGYGPCVQVGNSSVIGRPPCFSQLHQKWLSCWHHQLRRDDISSNVKLTSFNNCTKVELWQ